ncbi:hypothetical protein [Streptomyces sp. NPDC087525]|uniref:hypothetical protein n=1 Tax=Streptomyces sp. NPDC087525 TaxID=3365793 RepID=UPI00380C038C
MPILLGNRIDRSPGELGEGRLRDLLDRAAFLLGRLGDLREKVIEGGLRDLLDTRVDGCLLRTTGRAARYQCGRRLGGVPCSLGHDRLIDVPGDPAVTVPEGLGHDLDVDAGGQHERGGDVAQVVQPDGRQAGQLD